MRANRLGFPNKNGQFLLLSDSRHGNKVVQKVSLKHDLSSLTVDENKLYNDDIFNL